MDRANDCGSACLGQWTLILGEINRGKTRLCDAILRALCTAGLEQRILILDLAPDIPPDLARVRGVCGAGGKLAPPPGTTVLRLSLPLIPPRLTSRSAREARTKARENVRAIDQLLAAARPTARDIVFINDVTLYLQAGRARKLLQWLAGAETVVANGYSGERLGGGALAVRERSELEVLKTAFHRVLWL
jgi:hypothetical protein